MCSQPLSGRDFSRERATFHPGAENVPGRVHVAIMRRTAIRTFPEPYSQSCDTFRAADCTAVRTGCGSPSFVGFNVARPVPAGLVAEHAAEHRPSGVKNRLGHPCLGERGAAHIANDDQSVFPRNHRGLLMEMVQPRVRNLRVDRSNTASVVSSRSARQRRLVPSIVLKVGNQFAVARCGKALDTKIDPNLAGTSRSIFADFKLNRDVPATAGIPIEGSGFEFRVFGDAATQPQSIPALSENKSVTPKSVGPGGVDGNPAKAFLSCSPARAAPQTIPALREAMAYRRDCIRMKTEFRRAASERREIKGRGPAGFRASDPSSLGLALNLAAVVPDEIDRRRLLLQRALRGSGAVLDAIAVGENHLAGLRSGANGAGVKKPSGVHALGGFAICTIRRVLAQGADMRLEVPE